MTFFFVLKLSEAKELFKAENESTFNLDHCWAILKEHPKWQATQQENELRIKKLKDPKAKSTPSEGLRTPATEEFPCSTPPSQPLGEDAEDSNRGLLGSDVRSEGQKMAKRKRDDDAMMQRIINTQEELVKSSKERTRSIQLAMQSAADDRIMAMDLSNMDKEAKAYWIKKRRAILDRLE